MITSKAFLISTVALVIAAAVFPAASSPVGGSRADDEQCELARTFVEDNSSDAVGGTREALERGVAELNAALKHGCSNRKAALLTLSLGYNTLAYRYAAEGSAERKRFEDLETATHRALGPVAGDDTWALMLYAQTLDDAQRISVYRKITRLLPGDAEAHVALAKALIRVGRKSEAMKSFERALTVADQDALNRIDPEVGEFLRERGLDEEAAAMRAVAARRRATVGTPTGR